jgi:probable rRNA maturation factor
MIHIQFSPAIQEATQINQDVLRRAAHQTLSHTGAQPQVDLTVVLTDDDQIQALNRQFRGVDAPTDVLAFPGGEQDPDTDALYVGDVVISSTRANQQAETGGHSLEAEMQLLVVHGVLHLLGYDHASEEERTAMWAAQAQILSEIGCPITSPPF